MELKTKEQELSVSELLLDAFDEKPVDYDFVLPDYYPEMAAILKCTLCPAISGSQWSGDRLMVDGQVWIRVLYLDEKRNRVRSYECSQPFTSAFAVPGRQAQTSVQVSAKADYVNCRATGPRRMDVHGSFRVRAQILGTSARAALSGVEDGAVYTQTLPVTYSVPIASVTKPFSINETLELDGGRLAQAIIRREAVPVLSDCKILLGKLIIKGDLLLKTLYIGDEESGRVEHVSHELPFSQMVDMEGLSEDSVAEADIDLVASDMRISDEEGESGRALLFSAKLLLSVRCFQNRTADLLTDAYSTRFPLHLEHTQITTRRLLGTHRQTVTIKQSLDLPQGEIASVLDVWCDATVLDIQNEPDRRRINGRLQVSLLTADAEGLISYYERPADFTLDFAAEGTAETDTAQVIRTDFTVSPDRQLELRAELQLIRNGREEQTVSVVSGVAGDESESFPPETAAVKVVFAEAGESLWGIARDCHTSVDAVMQENDLTADTLTQDTMLLVPMC